MSFTDSICIRLVSQRFTASFRAEANTRHLTLTAEVNNALTALQNSGKTPRKENRIQLSVICKLLISDGENFTKYSVHLKIKYNTNTNAGMRKTGKVDTRLNTQTNRQIGDELICVSLS